LAAVPSLSAAASKAPPNSWLKKVIDSVVKDLLRKRADAPIPLSQLMEEESPINWEELLEAEEWTNQWRRREVQEVLESLSPTYRKVLVWCLMEGLSHREVAKRLGCKEGSVKVLLSKAKKAFRKVWRAG
jgi:RNA polymerase sigma factor (sigma-70 family)